MEKILAALNLVSSAFPVLVGILTGSATGVQRFISFLKANSKEADVAELLRGRARDIELLGLLDNEPEKI